MNRDKTGSILDILDDLVLEDEESTTHRTEEKHSDKSNNQSGRPFEIVENLEFESHEPGSSVEYDRSENSPGEIRESDSEYEFDIDDRDDSHGNNLVKEDNVEDKGEEIEPPFDLNNNFKKRLYNYDNYVDPIFSEEEDIQNHPKDNGEPAKPSDKDDAPVDLSSHTGFEDPFWEQEQREMSVDRGESNLGADVLESGDTETNNRYFDEDIDFNKDDIDGLFDSIVARGDNNAEYLEVVETKSDHHIQSPDANICDDEIKWKENIDQKENKFAADLPTATEINHDEVVNTNANNESLPEKIAFSYQGVTKDSIVKTGSLRFSLGFVA